MTISLRAALAAAPAVAGSPLAGWPRPVSAIGRDPALEARVVAIVSQMMLAQKVGQMTQPEIKSATPDDVQRYYLGSVLNGGGSWPNGDQHASAADWVALAIKVPVVWGIDAIHGTSNVYGATPFPHNIGLGAAHDPIQRGGRRTVQRGVRQHRHRRRHRA